MLFFLILSPYMAFTATAYLAPLTDSVTVAALVSLAINLADHLRGRAPKAVGLASTAMFAGMTVYFVFAETEWSGLEIRLALDLGIFTVALISIALRRPFTLQYARETVDEATQREPAFVQVNYVLTGVWAAAMALMMTIDILAIYLPWLPLWAGLAVTFVLRSGAVQFTKWYPHRGLGETATIRF
jgi:hypothetical protein